MVGLKWLFALGAAAALVGCGAQGDEASLPASGSTAPATTGAKPQAIEVGETVDFSMYTHCGVESTRINGHVWNAVEPLYASAEKLGPPVGWGNPEQAGELTVESADRAVFVALGQRVSLVPSLTGEPLRPCD
jgi:hypothetical protein